MTRILVVLLVGVLASACSSAPAPATGLSRCIWVDRWDYRTEADIERIMEDCSRGGFTAVMFQVRGNGTVYYPSHHEVWSEHFGYRSPGFDPLQVALDAARRRGLELHAWVNLVPGWIGDEPPPDERQLWNARPEWFLQDRAGQREPMGKGRYLGLNPCLPEVRRYLASICAEIARRYDVDGIHLDYVRFTDADYSGSEQYPRDPRSLALFMNETEAEPDDVGAFDRWKADCVTRLVQEVSSAVRANARPGAALTAAVFPEPEVALRKVQQDWPEWAERRLVDAVFPMNYSGNSGAFARRARAEVAAADELPVVIGVGVHLHDDPEQSVGQLEAALDAGARGVGVFNYRSLFGGLGREPTNGQDLIRRALSAWNLR